LILQHFAHLVGFERDLHRNELAFGQFLGVGPVVVCWVRTSVDNLIELLLDAEIAHSSSYLLGREIECFDALFL
jgi:hypothetical protein